MHLSTFLSVSLFGNLHKSRSFPRKQPLRMVFCNWTTCWSNDGKNSIAGSGWWWPLACFASQLLRFFPCSELNWDAGIEGYINLWCISSIWVLLKKTTRPVKLIGFGQVSSVSQSKKMCGSCYPIPNSGCGEKPEVLWHHWKRPSLPVAKYIYYIQSNVRSWWQTLTQDL